MKDNTKTIKRLISLSQLIIDEIDVLASLSYNNLEDSSQFDDHFTDIRGYINQEKVILNNISLKDLTEIFNDLSKYDDDSDAYSRCYVNIDDRLNALLDEEEKKKENDSTAEEISEEDAEVIEIIEDGEEDSNEDVILDKYFVDEEETEAYAIKVIDNISTIVIKKMLQRIMDTLADNKQDNKYKKRLIKYFQKFKYFYFTLDNQLELLGVRYRFDINKIPNPYDLSIDSAKIFHNQCVTILDKLYEAKDISYDPEKMEELLFNMMMLEEYLNGVNHESIDRLIELTDDLEQKYGINYFGNIAKQKILAKKN